MRTAVLTKSIPIALALGLASSAARGSEFDVFQVSNGNRAIYPSVSNYRVTWSDGRNGPFNVYVMDLLTHESFAVFPSSTRNQYPSDIDGDVVVFYSNGEGIVGRNIVTSQYYGVLSSGFIETNPTVSGSLVVWRQLHGTDNNIWGHDLSTGIEFQVSSTASNSPEYPDVSGPIVVWQDARNPTYDIFGKNVETGDEFPISILTNRAEYTPRISGDIVVWMEAGNTAGTDIWARNLSTGITFPICTVPGHQDTPAISGNIVVWFDRRNSAHPHVYGKNLDTGDEFVVCDDESLKKKLSISGDTVVWEDHRNGAANEEVFAATFRGACCFPEGYCEMVSKPACTGVWLGRDTPCSAEPCSAVTGDLNCDFQVSILDLPLFVEAMLGGFTSCEVMRADINGSGTIDGADVQAFVDEIDAP